jgi:hypothetical protein
MIKILKPKNSHRDTFRELLDLWSENGFCDLEESTDDFCWINNQGEILLYDHPRLDDRQIPDFKFGLFGNTVPVNEKTSPWIFWGRRPRVLEKFRKEAIPSFKERSIKSIFLGKIENNIQNQNRVTHDWSSCVELFNCPVDRPGPDYYKYSQEEYLNKLKQSKFGLCLAGYGPKCNREIELLGMGVIPVFTPQVNYDYYDPLIEGVHFIKIENTKDFIEKINSITEPQFNDMQQAGQIWFEKNCSVKGSFETTLQIINNYKGIR